MVRVHRIYIWCIFFGVKTRDRDRCMGEWIILHVIYHIHKNYTHRSEARYDAQVQHFRTVLHENGKNKERKERKRSTVDHRDDEHIVGVRDMLHYIRLIRGFFIARKRARRTCTRKLASYSTLSSFIRQKNAILSRIVLINSNDRRITSRCVIKSPSG